MLQEALPEHLQQVPGSMTKLLPIQQDLATYLNMIFNVAKMIQQVEKNNVPASKIKLLA